MFLGRERVYVDGWLKKIVASQEAPKRGLEKNLQLYT